MTLSITTPPRHFFWVVKQARQCVQLKVAKELKMSAHICVYIWASLMAQMVKNLPAMRETQVQSLGWDDPLEKGMATHSSILAWRISWSEDPGRLQSLGSQRFRYNWSDLANTPTHCTACGILVPSQRLSPGLWDAKAKSTNHRTDRECPKYI